VPKKRRKRKPNPEGDAGALPRRKVTAEATYGAVMHEILAVLKEREIVSADDIHRRLDIPKEGMKYLGPAFRTLQDHEVIEMQQIISTPRPDQKKNRIGVWSRKS
jgi:hypothetical protein